MTLWGGRFSESPDDVLWAYTASTVDRRLLAEDVAGSRAHVAMLGATGILPEDEVARLSGGLDRVVAEVAAGEFAFSDTDEDVHTAVERRLGELIGPVAGKLHTGRSRNDQVALDLRLWMRAAATRIQAVLDALVTALVDQAEAAGETVVASYTHLQQAQAVPFAHHLLAHAWALRRDLDRFGDALGRIDVSPLGAGAGGGSSLPLEPDASATALGMQGVFDNSLDAVAARDQAAEFVFCCAQAMATCSRLAEELVLWTTTEFGWAEYADRHTTGSSALPHKKNPDMAELARGKAAGVFGDVTTMLALQKGLPLAYNRDLQEDKAAVFHAADSIEATAGALAAMVAGARFAPPPPSPWVTALDLAEILVSRGVPFREAHEAVGRVVAGLLDAGRDLGDVTPADLSTAHEAFLADDVALVDPARSVARRTSPGGGSFASVNAQIAALRD